MYGMPLDARHEVLPDDSWIRELRKACGNDRIFLYYHRQHKTFVLSCWSSYPGEWPMAVELYSFENHPTCGEKMAWEAIVALCEPNPDRMIEQQIEARQDAEREQREADHDMAYTLAKQARKKGDEQEAALLETGHIPVHNEIHGDDEVEYRLRQAATSAQRVIGILNL